MAETLDFEEPIAKLLKELDSLTVLPRTDGNQRAIDALRQPPRHGAGRGLRVAHAVAARAGRAPSEPARSRRVHRAAVHRVRRDSRRPPLCRRPRDHDRLRRLQGPADPGRRTRQGRGHEGEDLPELRLRAARRLSQGAARDAARREVRPADRDLRRHAGGVPGDRVRRARRRRSDRRQPARHDAARHAGHRHRQRRGRERRRARHRRRRLA